MEQLWPVEWWHSSYHYHCVFFPDLWALTQLSYIIEGLAVLWQPKYPKKQMLRMQGADLPPHALGNCMNWQCQFMNMRSLEVWSIPRSVSWSSGSVKACLKELSRWNWISFSGRDSIPKRMFEVDSDLRAEVLEYSPWKIKRDGAA